MVITRREVQGIFSGIPCTGTCLKAFSVESLSDALRFTRAPISFVAFCGVILHNYAFIPTKLFVFLVIFHIVNHIDFHALCHFMELPFSQIDLVSRGNTFP